jgi:hypothetical protein
VVELALPTRAGSMCFLKNSEQLVVGFDDKVALYDAHSGSLVHRTNSDSGLMWCLAPGPEDLILGIS